MSTTLLNSGENSKNKIFQKSPKNACFDNVSTLVKPLKDLPDDSILSKTGAIMGDRQATICPKLSEPNKPN